MKKTFFLIIIFIVSCKREKIRNTSSVLDEKDVVFYFRGSVGTQSINLEAGKGNYYMYTFRKYDTSLKTFSFHGRFSQYSAEGSYQPMSLKITLLDDTIKPSTSPSSINKFTPGNYEYFVKDSSIMYALLKAGVINNTSLIMSYSFQLNNQFISSNNALTNYTIFPASVPYTLNLIKSEATYSCFATLTNSFNLTPGSAFCANLSTTSFSGMTSFYLYSYNAAWPVTYTLHYGNSLSTTINNATTNPVVVNYTYTSYQPDFYPYVIARDMQNNISTFTLHIKPFFFNPCIASYSFQLVPKRGINFKNKIQLSWTNMDNEEYLSELQPQPSWAVFQILGVWDYDRNENNFPTKKISAYVKARLYKKSNPAQFLDLDGYLVFGVAY